MLAYAVAYKGLDIIISPKVDFINGNVAQFQNVSFMGKDENNINEVDVEVDMVILCTGFSLNFDWIRIEGEEGIEANPRKWFKHCFPPSLGHKMAFLGYARPAQGGIPQCSELLARYVALVLKAERILPKDYAKQALREGQLETETFYSTPNAYSLVEFSPFASSIARLIGCEPSVPKSPTRFVKFWTLPQWMCFYRLDGPGANPNSCWKIVDEYATFEALVPMPLLVVYIIFGALLQLLMIAEFLITTVVDRDNKKLPRWYKWRVGGHHFQLSGNHMRLRDLINPSFGFLLIEILLLGSLGLLSKNPYTFVFLLFVGFVICFRKGFGNFVRNDQYTEVPEIDELFHGEVVV